MDNKSTEAFEEIDHQIDGIILYLLKKYAVKNELSPKHDSDLTQEKEACAELM